MNMAANITVEEGLVQPFITLRNGIRLRSAFCYTPVLELCSVVFHTPHHSTFLFMTGMPFPPADMECYYNQPVLIFFSSLSSGTWRAAYSLPKNKRDFH